MAAQMDENDKLPFTAHLEELRDRLIRCAIAIAVGFVIAYLFKEKLFHILTRPLIRVMEQGDTLIFTGIPEAFFTYLKVSLLAGILLAVPVIMYEFWMFVAPGLYKNERRMLIPIALISSVFFVGGALFGYFIVFPYGFKFLLGFATETLRPLPSMKEYLSFATKLLLAFGFVF
jgi:sec-independent protein translocase protein TatC